MRVKPVRLAVAASFLIACRFLPSDSPSLLLAPFGWALLLVLAGWVSEPLVRSLFFRDPLASRFAARPLGLLLWVWASWWLPALGFYPRTRLAIEVSLLLLALLGDFLSRRPYQPRDAPPAGRALAGFEAAFWSLFVGFLALKAWTPEIFWGEKPMDFTFFNYFMREERFPPQDPWAAGLPLHYYYFGPLLAATPARILGLPGGAGYLLALATLPAFLFAGSAAFLLRCGLAARRACVVSFLVPLLSGLTALALSLKGSSPGFDLYWNASRAFTSPAFAEWPLWAFLFGDLHAHVIALPYFVIALSFLFRAPDVPVAALGMGFLLGALAGLNAWGAVVLGVAALPLLVIRRAHPARELFPALIASLVCFGPLLVSLTGGRGFRAGVALYGGPYNEADQLLFFFAPGLVGVALGVLASLRSGVRPGVQGFWPTLVPLLSLLANLSASNGGASSALAISFCLAVATSLTQARAERFLLLSATLWIALSESLTLFDRMNTVFKTYDALGFSLFTAGALGAIRSLHSFPRIAWTTVAVTLLLSSLSSGITTLSFLRDRKVPGPRPSLDGVAYLESENPDEAALFRWLRKNARGTPTVIEAHGPPYGAFGRVAMHTGLPSFLGWDWHVFQRGVSREEIRGRERLVRLLYTSGDPEEQAGILHETGARYVVLSRLERETYGVPGLSSLESFPSRFHWAKIAFEQGQAKLLEIAP